MKVGVLGSGTVGQTLAAGFLKHGHELAMGTRDPGAEDLRSFQAKTPGVKIGSFQEAAKFGELLVYCPCSPAPSRTSFDWRERRIFAARR